MDDEWKYPSLGVKQIHAIDQYQAVFALLTFK